MDIHGALNVGDVASFNGFVTRASVLRGKTGDQIERALGFEAGRLRDGWRLLFFLQLPTPDQFQFRGYTQMSGGIPRGHLASTLDRRTAEQRLADNVDDIVEVKRRIIRDVFRLSGPDRLAKVWPTSQGTYYPPGAGFPQWELMTYLPFRVAAIVSGVGMYLGDYS